MNSGATRKSRHHGLRDRANKRRHPALGRMLKVESLEDRTLLTVVALTPTKDNTLIENASGEDCTSTYCSNGAGNSIFVGRNNANSGTRIRRGLLAFDVAGTLPAGATINSATLTMWVNRTRVGDTTVELHKVLADWGEGGSVGTGGSGVNAQTGDATWAHTFFSNQFWTNPGGDFSSTVSGSQDIGSQNNSYTWSSTAQMVADVQDWLDNPSTDFGWLLQNGVEDARSSKRFDSRESSTASRRPTLTIDFTEAAAEPDISISDVTLAEGNAGTTTFNFEVTLSAPSTQTVTVNFTTADGEAVAGADYQTNSGVVTFMPMDTSETISVSVIGETIVETDETFVVNLSGAVNGNILDAQGVGTITNDDVGPLAVGDDIIGMQTATGDLWLAHSQGNQFTNTNVLDIWSTTADWRDVQSGDFNGDGRADFVGRNNNSGYWWITSLDSEGTVETTKWGKWSNTQGWNDVLVGDFNNDQLDDIAGRASANGAWWVAISDGTKFSMQRWGAWSNNVVWNDVVVGDFNGNGYDDLAGRASSNGAWWLAVSDGTSFSNQRWGQWSPNATWLDVQAGDFNNDGRTDVAGRDSNSGNWWVANSSGTDFTNEKWGSWSSSVGWTDVLVGDFNNNGRADIVGRAPMSGNWYVAESTGSAFTTSKWGSWSSGVVWEDVVLGDFNADGNDELAGRVQGKGDWWVALSNGTSFTNQKWGNWPTVAWQYVQAGEFLD